jgi:hypothetical protein
MIYSEPICERCKHILNEKPGYFCKAFPEGIPEEILTGDNNHSKPLPEQTNDIVFEKVK